MLAVLPCAALIASISAAAGRQPEAGWRSAVVRGSTAWGAALVALTESLSLMHRLDRSGIAVGWAVVAAGFSVCVFVNRRSIRISKPGMDRYEGAALSGLALLLVAVGIAGARSDPNTWDSLTYHLTRVAHWLQDSSVAHFETSNVRQVDQPPFAEFVVTHVVALAGTDRVAFLVQWFALFGSCVIASRIAQQLGGDRTAQVASAIVCGTAPMALLQASSTQNDLVETFLFLGLCSLALEATRSGPRAVLVPMAGTAALAVLTKGTAVVLVPAPLIYALWHFRGNWRGLLPPLAVGATLAAALVFPHFARNFAMFGSLVAPETAQLQALTDPGVGSLASNGLRNAAIELAVTDPRINDRVLVKPVTALHRFFGLDENEPRWSFNRQPFEVTTLSTNEDFAGNPIHFLMGAFACALAVVVGRLRTVLFVPTVFILAGFLLFCAGFRWQPWGTRLMLPLGALTAPVVVLTLVAIGKRRVVWMFVVTLFVGAIPAATANNHRPLAGATYFKTQPALKPTYERAVTTATGHCSRVGLDLGGNTFEYPIWQMAPKGVVFRHVDVETSARQPPRSRPSACAVISSEVARRQRTIEGHRYDLEWTDGVLSVYRKGRLGLSLIP